METGNLYDLLFAPISAELGPFDPGTLTAIVGFDAGGPIGMLTIGRNSSNDFVSYVSCELAVREDQIPSDFGRYELLVTCDEESWAREILTNVGQMSTEVQFGHGHTLDIGSWVDDDAHLQGLAFETFCDQVIEEQPYGVFRLHGLTRSELNSAVELGVQAVLENRKRDSIYPCTRVHRRCD